MKTSVKDRLTKGLTLSAASLALSGCALFGTAKSLTPFSSDGCSLFPDGWPTQPDLWLDCCVEHDIAYWQGGTSDQRLMADVELKRCVARVTGDAILADNMFLGVRFGGHPIFPNWYRWGYGWPYGRQYKPLTKAEKKQVEELLADWQSQK